MFGWLNKTRRGLGRRAGRVRLLYSIVLAILAALAIASGAQWTINHILHINPSADAKVASTDIVRLSLTVVGGVGGVVALVIAYRRQRDLEQGRFVERFGAAAAQLGDSDVAVRIAGVYAMAGVADESDRHRRQQCVNVLCGYLRLPYQVAHGNSGRTKLVVKAPGRPDGHADGETEEHIEYRQNDREVRRTILTVIADHLHSGAEYCWSASDFDFRTAHLEYVDLHGTTFSGAVRFDEVTFLGDARLGKAVFDGDVTFTDAKFKGDAGFGNAVFRGEATFTNARFTGSAGFSGATFTTVNFTKAEFTGDARFGHAVFTRSAGFEGATFIREAGFGYARFARAAGFKGTTFTGTATFKGTKFFGPAEFERSKFLDGARFTAVTFAGGDTSFRGVEFGTARISFANPTRWGPPPPQFDWDNDPSRKPANIEPQQWPPVPAP
ncbi:pentapeptide repeat-containing protein [Nocardia sp. NPDC052566]|uniref:pentapeptide repeat-containing protein n=1 Tax=Nocardia sp. NPDC052566 TaxID=3364330 RepID=UPI0037C53BA5